MNAQDLKNSILQLAVQGKLVEQRAEEGTARELLEQIKLEKEQLIKDKKIKKSKPLPEITEDEIPFEIPESWEWVRLNVLFEVLNGDRGKNYPAKSTLHHEGIPFISAVNLDGKSVLKDDNLLCLSKEQYDKLGNGKLIKGDVVVCIRGSLGKHGKYPFDVGAIASSLVICRQYADDEILSEYFIPSSWKWVRLGNICTKLVDGDHNPPKGVDKKTDYIMASSTNINNNTIVDIEKVRYLTQDIFEKENERTQATDGDIFFTSVGTLGRSCVYKGGYNICFQRSVSVIRTLILNYYLKYTFDSAYFQYKINREATGTAQKGFYLKQLAMSLIPIPPLEEQQRIVAKIEELLPYCDQLIK